MKKELTFNLILTDRVQKLLDDFATVMNVQIVFLDRNGKLLKQGRAAECTPFCLLMQNEYFSLESCEQMDKTTEEKCAKSGKCECYTCHAGLCEAVMPVSAPEAGLLGYMRIGQFRNVKTLPEKLLAMAGTSKKQRELKRAYGALPLYTMDAFRKMSELLELLVDYIVRCELIKLDDDLFYVRLCDYINANFQKKITPASAAKALGCSVSGLFHALQEKGHKSFLSILTERRLKNAEHLLLNSPEMTIAEASLQSGFQDPYYFSRVYRRYRGFPPSQLGNL